METVKDKLPEEFKSKWVAALRSGEYKQGETLLYSKISNKYCCLGVACRVAGLEPMRDDGAEYISPLLDVPDLLKGKNDITHRLAKMNDGVAEYTGKAKSFSEIADYIEANL